MPNKKLKLAIGSDHNGFAHKSYLIKNLRQKYDIIDIGPYEKSKVDYPDISYQLSKLIENNYIDKGILICGTGVGMSISANRNIHINAALVQHLVGAELSVQHNDANVLCLSSWVNSEKRNLLISKKWLETKFKGGRHVRRLSKITKKYKVSLVSGVFDLLHQGHIELLKYASTIADKTIVLINSDKSVKRIKGKFRPLMNEKTRKKILESFNFVDEVIIFNESSPGSLINKINPDFFVRGSEHSIEEIRRRDNLDKKINIRIYPIKNDLSTTNMINKIKKLKFFKKSDFLDKL